jgi:UDP-glucose 4-epimerase
MRVLVTGCNGYIGSHVVHGLKQHGHHVAGWDINVHGEYNDIRPMLDMFMETDVTGNHVGGTYDAVIHLAGLSAVAPSVLNPTAYYHTNILGTENVVKNTDTGHVLFASTSSAWEMASPYARSKVAAEDVIKELSDNYTIFRFFNVSGTNGAFRQLGPATHLIRVAAEVAAGKRDHLDVYGTDYNTPDGTCIRDYVHVMDLANALVESVSRGPCNTPYECIGSNHGWSVFEVIDVMRQVTGHAIPVKIQPRRPGDAVASVVDQISELVTLSHSIDDMCLDQYRLECAK